MRAREVKCPECRAGFRDVAPSFEIGSGHVPGYETVPGSRGAISGHCEEGHYLIVNWEVVGNGFTRFSVGLLKPIGEEPTP